MIGQVTGALMAAVWQGVLLAAVVWLGLRLLPKTPAAVRFAIWFGVFLVVTALPVISLWPHGVGLAKASGRGVWLTLDARWSLAIAAVWLVASAVRAGTLVMAVLRVRALWKRATPVELGLAAESVAGSRRARLCTSDEVDRPTVIGFFSPKIVLPDWLLERLTAAELEQIVLHETGHLGRADDWMNLLQKIALVVFPLNPALAWVERRLCFERELAVDERVLRTFAGKAGAATAYAACLTNLAEHRLGRRGLTLALGALGRESELGRRVRRILRRGEGMKPLHARLVLGGAMLGLLGGAAGLERCPQVIGFAPAGAQNVARAEQWQPARGGQTAMNGASIVRVHAVQMVIGTKVIQQNPNVPHETLLMTPEQTSGQSTLTESSPNGLRGQDKTSADPVRMVQTKAVDSGRRNRSSSISDVEPSRPAVGAVEWVVVTSWQDENGASRSAMTAARAPDGAQAADNASDVQQQQPRSEEVHPYAAAPVRGGWLVFQL
jgi:hypothetical protein